MPQKSDIPKDEKRVRPVPLPGGPQRVYSNFVLVQSSENETQLTFCDVEPLLAEQAQTIAEQQKGIHPVPVVAKIVLSHKVAKVLGEILAKQTEERKSGNSRDSQKS